MRKVRTLRIFCSAFVVALVLTGVSFSDTRAEDLDQAAFDKAMNSYLQDEKNVEKVGGALQRYFMKMREKQMKQMEEQRKNAAARQSKKTEEQFKNPVAVDIGDSPVKGNPSAPITIVEFSDFDCPFCKRVLPTLSKILEEYEGKVRLVFKPSPLPMHPNARPASKAAWAAKQQGKFWEYHDMLFENQKTRGEEAYLDFAKNLGLDLDKFKKDMNSAEAEKAVSASSAQAAKLGVAGTPGFFINGVQLRGAQPFPAFKNIIDRWLEKLGDKK